MLVRSVPTWLTFADQIVIADQGSTDGTRDILRSFGRVTCVDNPETDYHEGNRNALLASEARKISTSAILVFLDADEILSANVITSPEWKRFCALKPGTAGAFYWILLWKTPLRYIKQGVGAPSLQPFAFIDDGRDTRDVGTMHRPRGIGLNDPAMTFVFNEIVNLHLGTAFFQKVSRRQNWYKVWWRNRGGKYYHTNRNHNWVYNVKDSQLADVRREWIEGYAREGLDVTSIVEKDLLSYDIDVLRWMAEKGEKSYHFLDIWDGIDWEALRLKALERGLTGMPAQPIRGPGRFVRFLHRWLSGRVTMRQMIVSARRRIVRGLLP